MVVCYVPELQWETQQYIKVEHTIRPHAKPCQQRPYFPSTQDSPMLIPHAPGLVPEILL